MNPIVTLEKIERRAATVRQMHVQYGAFVDRCVAILYQAHDFGWQVALRLNGERSVRKAESLLGFDLRSDFRPSTQLSRLIYDT